MRSRLLVRGFWALGVFASATLCGCINPYNTRLPTVGTPPPPIEKRSYDIHDPFPDEELGPDTATRPLGFNQPRAEQRKILEGRSLLGLPPGSSTGSFNYPDAVPQ